MQSTSIVRSDDLRSENRGRLLNALRSNGPCTPSSLACQTGLSAASISSLTSQLAEQDIVQCTRQKNLGKLPTRGRPQSQIELNGAVGDIITLNLSIDRLCVCRSSYAGKLLRTESIDVCTREMSEDALLDLMAETITRLMHDNTEQPVLCIGVAFQGVTENASGTLSWSPILQQRNLQLGSFLQNTFNLPVSVNNDCRLISEALIQNHSERLGNSFATVLFSHGIGLGLYIDGKPFSGIRTSALEMGHLCFERDGALCRCGKKGCIEAYAADYGIQRLAIGQSIHDAPSGRLDATQMPALCHEAASGNDAAMQAFVIAGAAIGEGLATLFALLDPLPVAVVGRNDQAIGLMVSGMNSAFRDQRGDCVEIDKLLHCFDDAEPLLASGLLHNTLAKVDRQFATMQTTDL